jgi:hypothetical protein
MFSREIYIVIYQDIVKKANSFNCTYEQNSHSDYEKYRKVTRKYT